MREKLVLAALMHDIGKFWQRADDHFLKSDTIREVYNGNYDITVPLYENGNPKYIHALWTNAFFEKTKTESKLKLNVPDELTLSNLSANHHKPNNHFEAIISIADKWSSGIDRPDTGEEGVSGYKEVKEKYGNDFVNKVALHSIFDTINKKNYSNIEDYHCYKLNELDISKESIFPEKGITTSKSAYSSLWDNFFKEYSLLAKGTTDFRIFYQSLLTLLKKYTWGIPSATNLIPANVSLFEHLKSTAAIALSLYDYCEEEKHSFTINEYNRVSNYILKDSLLMVCVDVSGIQNFIYDILSKKAASSLKGRSFFLEVMIQGVLTEILNHEDINAFPSNIIYSSGGKAYLILPNTKKVKGALESIQSDADEKLFNYAKGKLSINIGFTSFRYHTEYLNLDGKGEWHNEVKTDESKVIELYYTNENPDFSLSNLWRSVSDKAANRKNIKFRKIYLDNYNQYFLDGEDFENSKLCDVTGYKINGKPNVYGKGDTKIEVSQEAADQIELGKELRTTKEILYHSQGHFSVSNLGHNFSLQQSGREIGISSISLNEWPDFTNVKYGKRHMFYGGNYQPTHHLENRTKTFEELCFNENGETTKLGVLRMDIDNLGQIFIEGLIDPSFSAYATLSMFLDTFFAGYLNTIQKSKELYNEHIQIIYSGGDDIFAVGRWDAIVELAGEVKNQFFLFTKRKDISISAGIVIVDAKYPIYKAASDAGIAEKKSKEFESVLFGNKNAVTVFNQTVSWDKEWEEVIRLKNEFLKNIDELPRSVLHSIQNFSIRKEKESDLSYLWHSGYHLSRMMERLKKSSEAKELVEYLRDQILHSTKYGDRFIKIAAIAARLAEYYLK